MKVLSKAAALESKQLTYIDTERRILDQLRHPFICSFHYSFQTANKLYLLLDYCPGGEFLSQIHPNGISEDRVRFYTAELVLALGYIHSHGVAYRDLKPENVLLNEHLVAKIADFGISREAVTRRATTGASPAGGGDVILTWH